ncbi:hypothetical protein BGZ76_009359 [Entomortierella beljakovae]|nr:hypothetical protein BGZ76_009359 [Entomortierella beljakovae]
MNPLLTNNVISTLPIECLEMIIAFLGDDLSALHSLLFASRQFFQLTVPVLYQSPFMLSMNSQETAGNRSTHDRTTEWEIHLTRTKLLTKLLIQNLQINHLGETSKPAVSTVALMDDDSGGFEKIEPLLPPVNNDSWSFGHQSLEIPNDWTNHIEQTPTSNSWDNDGWDNNPSDQPANQDYDLIDLNGEWDYQPQDFAEQQEEGLKTTNKSLNNDNSNKSGLLMDYFHFYTHLDHRSIQLVIREIYPGAGRRQYERYLEDINKAILMHNPKKIEMIHIKSPLSIVQHLQEHSEKFERLSRMEFQDSIWSSQELDMIYGFLLERSAMVPRSAGLLGRKQEGLLDQYLEMKHSLGLDHTASPPYQCSPIRHIKYESRRNQWDQATLAKQPYNPLQLMKLMGPGLKTIDTMYWYKTKPSDLETLDVSSLRTLKVGFLDTPSEDHSFSRPEFLSRCRKLEHLETFSSSKDMFRWAVKDWNEEKRKKKELTSTNDRGSSILQTTTDTLVRLQRMQILVPTDQIAYEILRDSFYGFRDTLYYVEALSEGECVEGEAEWMDRAQELLSGVQINKSARVERKVETQRFDEEEYLDSLSSISSKLLLIQWEIPYLSTLDLTGPIAAAFDIGSLLFMPKLHTVCFSIFSRPFTWIARGKSNKGSGGVSGSHLEQSERDMRHLPFVAPHTLRRIMIRGPWPEITDQSIQAMISTIIHPAESPRTDGIPNHNRRMSHFNDVEGFYEGDFRDQSIGNNNTWGNQLLEFTVLDNERVTVPNMIQLAHQMDNLQVMGMSLSMPSVVYLTADEECHFEYPDNLEVTNQFSKFEELDKLARDLILKAQIEMSWVDIGNNANHLGRRNRRERYHRRELV